MTIDRSEPSPPPRPGTGASALSTDAASVPPASTLGVDAAGEPEDDARTPAEYTETPGSHRRPEDGAALDVGG